MYDEIPDIIRKTIGLHNRYMISTDEIMKTIKVLYARNNKAIAIIKKYFKDEGLTMYHDTSQHLYPIFKALKGDDENEK